MFNNWQNSFATAMRVSEQNNAVKKTLVMNNLILLGISGVARVPWKENFLHPHQQKLQILN